MMSLNEADGRLANLPAAVTRFQRFASAPVPLQYMCILRCSVASGQTRGVVGIGAFKLHAALCDYRMYLEPFMSPRPLFRQ